MTVLVIGLAWIVVHFLIYITRLRQSDAASTEAGILRLHAFSFVGLAVLGLVVSITIGPDDAFAGFIAAVSLHAVYSISFLEAWSVTEGSFVFHTLSRIDRAGDKPLDLSDLETVGASKRSSRLRGLETLGLVSAAGNGNYHLTKRGRVVCTVTELLASLTNVRQGG